MFTKDDKDILIGLIQKAINGDEASRRILAYRNIRLREVDVDFLMGNDSNPMAEIRFILRPGQIVDRKQCVADKIKMYEKIIEKNKESAERLDPPISPIFYGIILPIIICLIVLLLGVQK